MTAPLFEKPTVEIIHGFTIHRGWLGVAAQTAMLTDLRAVIAAAPLVRPVTPWGKPMSVRMTSAGRVGWVIKRGRYAYTDTHPETGVAWPAIPQGILDVWRHITDWQADPDCCLINWYGEAARMGLHQDKDEGTFEAPVVSISLGDPARFRMGSAERKGATASTVLNSGDVVVIGGPARLAHHGIDKVYFGDGSLLPEGGRLNLTLRVVAPEIGASSR